MLCVEMKGSLYYIFLKKWRERFFFFFFFSFLLGLYAMWIFRKTYHHFLFSLSPKSLYFLFLCFTLAEKSGKEVPLIVNAKVASDFVQIDYGVEPLMMA